MCTLPPSVVVRGTDPGQPRSATSVTGTEGGAGTRVRSARRRGSPARASTRSVLARSSPARDRRARPPTCVSMARLDTLYLSSTRSPPDQWPDTDTAASVTSLHRRRSPRAATVATGSSTVPPMVPLVSSSPLTDGASIHHWWSCPRRTRASYVTSRSPRLMSRRAVALTLATGESIVIAARDSHVPARATSARARSRRMPVPACCTDPPRDDNDLAAQPPRTVASERQREPAKIDLRPSGTPDRQGEIAHVHASNVERGERPGRPGARGNWPRRDSRRGIDHDIRPRHVEPAQRKPSENDACREVHVHAFRAEERARRAWLGHADAVKGHAGRTEPVLEAGGARLDPQSRTNGRGTGSEKEGLTRTSREEGDASGGEDGQQQ